MILGSLSGLRASRCALHGIDHFMALTASAPPSVKSHSQFLEGPVMVSGNLDRSNIFMSASPIMSIYVGRFTF
jgi:hypothetical protein